MQRITGIDENGLGPLLAPLIATSVTLELHKPKARLSGKTLLELGIGDSKKVSAFGAMAHTESIALALLARVFGHAPQDFDSLIEMLALTPEGEHGARLRAPCPSSSTAQCWSTEVVLPAFQGSQEDGEHVLEKLQKRGAHLLRARSVVCCVARFNELTVRHKSKFTLDLRIFEELIHHELSQENASEHFLCGMVGGIRDYNKFWGPRMSSLGQTLVQSRKESTYRFAARDENEAPFEVHFEVDADAHHLAVSLASMVGKYLRELFVLRQNRFYQSHAEEELPHASGYHDPVTKRFVGQTESLRRRLGIIDDCFLRRG